MPRANLYILEVCHAKVQIGWHIIPPHIGQAAYGKRKEAAEAREDLQRDTIKHNAEYRVRRARFLDRQLKTEH